MNSWALCCALVAAGLLAGCGSTFAQPGPTSSVTSPVESEGTLPGSSASFDVKAVSNRDARVVRDFVHFALQPTSKRVQRIPLSHAGVMLGIGRELTRPLPLDAASEPSSWVINRRHYEGYEGPFSGLRFIKRHVEGSQQAGGARLSGDLQASAGHHPHCAGPAKPAPDGMTSLRRVSVQPAKGSISDCTSWFTVDLFLNESNEVVAVTLDIFGA